MIFISTGGYRWRTAFETSLEYLNNGILGIELSGGKYSESFKSDLLSISGKTNLRVHNYFPPPEVPFVLNLASNDPAVSKKSIDHVIQGIKLSASLKSPVYSFHAGFRMNPKADDLGNRLGIYQLTERERALEIFGGNVSDLAEIARIEGVELLIENNVVNATNYKIYNEDPFLLTGPIEIDNFMSQAPNNVGLLLDVAHLKVSAKTLDFNLTEAHHFLYRWIRGYHLSDNDGNADSNQIITSDSWFWKTLKLGLDYYSLEIYNVAIENLLQQSNLLASQIFSTDN